MNGNGTTPTARRVPISALPLPPPTHSLTHNLTPDPHTATPAAWLELRKTRPSVQRRARMLAPPAHFSYVAPLPAPFPFRVAYPDLDEEGGAEAQVEAIERWLTEREALEEVPCAGENDPVQAEETKGEKKGRLRKYVSAERDDERVLIGLAETGLRDTVPHLDVGDAFDLLGEPSLSATAANGSGTTANGDRATLSSEAAVAARQELIDVLSGHALLASYEGNAETQWAPWSVRYSGHQFGNWAGQLGDGRAISLLSTPHPEDPETTYELQLKGPGRTPFSRMADGLAVLRSSIREYLCSEAMHALSIPTTRSLALISLPKLPVERETVETACVLTRVAPSFLRIGSFEALNPPANMFFFGGGQQPADLDALRVLGEWVARRVLKLEGVRWAGEGEVDGPGDAWGKELVFEVTRRNARMVAGWQAYGFMHGVINTDNVSILGLTIDYGPYAFMDVFDPLHICNHSDEGGRYAYQYQPSMIIYALRSLLTALAPLIGAEDASAHAVAPGWASAATPDTLKEWTARGLALAKSEMERIAEQTCADEYARLMHARLALRRVDADDEARVVRPLLDLLREHRLDFHGAFRRLARGFTPGVARDAGALEEFVGGVLALSAEPERLDRARAEVEWRAWLEGYAARIESERELWEDGGEGDVDAKRTAAAEGANPRFVLRQWLLEEVIKKVEADPESGKRVLGKVLHMACNPFEPWGAEDFTGDESALDAEVKEERRYCGIGERKLLGFQCSCSS